MALRQLVVEAPDGGPCPEVRLVGHWGPLLVDVQAPDPTAHLQAFGETLAWPVRLLGQATAGEILVSPGLGDLVAGWYEMEAREVPLAGRPPRQARVYAVVGPKPQGSRLELHRQRPLSRFVGRDRELATLQALMVLVAEGRGQVAGLMGEPGMGKSRLCYECITRHLGPPWACLETRAVAYGQAIPYLPMTDLLKAYFRLDDRARASTIRDRVTATLLALDAALQPMLPAFLTLLDVPVEEPHWQALDPPQRRQRLLDAIKRLLVQASQEQPLLVIVENLHWIDTETQACLDSLVESLPTAHLLLLVTYRPEYQHGWGHKTYYTQLRLDPLSHEHAQALLDALLGDAGGLAPLKQRVLARTQGNPFFVEESVQTLIETGGVVGEPGAYRLGPSRQTLQVPATVQAVLAARVDRLPLEAKHLLQTAAVIGPEVPVPLLRAVAELDEGRLHRGLAQLRAAELLYETWRLPECAYTFKHALTQEVAYQSLLKCTRQQVHHRIAQVLEAQFPDTVETRPELLAQHYTEAGLTAQAVSYWLRAGTRASQRSAYVEAVAHCTKGLTLLTTLPHAPEHTQCELALQLTLGSAFMTIKGHGAPEAEHAYTRAHALCQQVENTPQYFRVLRGLWAFALARGALQTARGWGEQLLTLAQRGQDPTFLLQAHLALGLPLFHLGECTPARVHLEQGITFYDVQRHRSLAFRAGQDPGVTSLACAAWVLWVLGYPDQAQQRSQEALTLAQELAHPASLAYALHFAGVVHQLRREEHAAHTRAEAVMTLATEQGFAQRVAQGTILRGWALAAQGQEAEGLGQMRQGLAAYQATGAEVGRPHMLALLAEAYRKGGQAEEGLRVVAEALATVHTTGEQYYEAELYRLKGEFLLARSLEQHAEADTCFRQALAIACRQQAKSLELRAAMSLARLWQHQGKRAEAYELLAPLYSWFTEGFDTADLQEAKALLRGLGS